MASWFATRNGDGAFTPTETAGTVSDAEADRLADTADDYNPPERLSGDLYAGRTETN